MKQSPLDAPWDPLLSRPLPRDAGLRRSRYLTMRDGTKLAVDLTLPSTYRTGQKLPTILRQTRYFRSVELPRSLDFAAARDAFDISAPTREHFLAAGYAWVDVDVRGSGVSFGTWPLPWSPAEVGDGVEIADFIVKQPWSNGLIGSTGISYEGTTAEMLVSRAHPAVRAIAPRFSLLCAYEDVAFPGGAQLAWFTEGWSRFNALLDAHRFHDAMAGLVGIVAKGQAAGPGLAAKGLHRLLELLGPERTNKLIGLAFGTVFLGGRRVDEDPQGVLRKLALATHAGNGDVHDLVSGVDYRDDSREGQPERAFDLVSPRGHLEAIRASGAAVFSYGGFFDGAYAQAAARRHRSLPGSRLLLGPWGHAGVIAHPGRGLGAPAAFPHDALLLRFFDTHLKPGSAALDEPNVRFFTMGAGVWRTAQSWPPEHVRPQSFTLTSQRKLEAAQPLPSPNGPSTHSFVELQNDPNFGTGDRSRWRGVLAAFVPADYPDLALRFESCTHFDTEPLARETTITGHPVLRLSVRSNEPDLVVIAYLIDVAADGACHYVTEGHLRTLHRDSIQQVSGVGVERDFARANGRPLVRGETHELCFNLLPTSHRLPAGHRLRLVITLGDSDHFAKTTPDNARLGIATGGHASTLELPIEGSEAIDR